MKSLVFLGGVIGLSGFVLGQNSTSSTPRALIDQYCVTCHNQRAKTAGLMLDKMDPAHVAQDREAWEKAVRKLRAGMMPPQGMPRPNDATQLWSLSNYSSTSEPGSIPQMTTDLRRSTALHTREPTKSSSCLYPAAPISRHETKEKTTDSA